MDLNDILVFVRVAQAGSFSKASQLLGMPISTVSRRVAELEEELGVPLLVRTTRSLKITDVGKSYLEHGIAIAAELEKAQALATNLQSIPQGTLKVTATTDFGNRFLGKIVCDFLKVNPQVKAEIVLTERVVDLIEEGFDLAIRIGELEDSTLKSRRLGSMDMQLYASPQFVASHGEPKVPSDLSKFECVRFTGEDDSNQWQLTSPRDQVRVEVKGRICSNNMALIRDITLAGEGIALMPHFMCVEDLKAGRLKVLLREWAHVSGPIHIVYPGQRFLLPRVKLFVEHLMQSCINFDWRYKS